MPVKVITKDVAPAFDNFMFDWDYEKYLVIGGYGSGKSYHVALKIVLKLLGEKRKVLVVREVYDTIFESCYSLFSEILESMGLFTEDSRHFRSHRGMVLALKSPLRFRFTNGSQIIFKAIDKPEKVKSINGVSIVWFEEASEIKYAAYKELLGRIRMPEATMHFFLSCNPINMNNWIYRHFFVRLGDNGKEKVILKDEIFYDQKEVVIGNTYYHHSVPDDNPWLPKEYIKRLDEIKAYDYPLWMVARHGRFGASGTRVLPQLEVATDSSVFRAAVSAIPIQNHYYGFDFGFEESYNAVLSMAVDIENSILYVYDEIYTNHVTDDVFAQFDEMQRLKRRINSINDGGVSKMLVADNADPKAITYYRSRGFKIRACRNKFVGSRLSNTRKMKRFKKIIVSPKCRNTIRECKDLTYAKDAKGNVIYDKFNIDPHTFSAMWYGLDMVTVADVKDRAFNSKGGDGGNGRYKNQATYGA